MRAGKQPLAKHLVAFRFWNGIQNEHENKCQQKISEKKEENMDKNDNGKRCQWQYALAPRSSCMWNNRNNNNTNSTHWWNVTVDLFTAILVCILLSMNAKHLEITTFCITKSNALSLFCDILAFLSWYPFFFVLFLIFFRSQSQNCIILSEKYTPSESLREFLCFILLIKTFAVTNADVKCCTSSNTPILTSVNRLELSFYDTSEIHNFSMWWI